MRSVKRHDKMNNSSKRRLKKILMAQGNYIKCYKHMYGLIKSCNDDIEKKKT